MSRASVVEAPLHLEGDLRTLCLPAMRQQWRRVTEEAARRRQSHAECLAELLHLEVTHRREARIARRMKEARFPVVKTLDQFDFTAQPAVKREEVEELARGDFLSEHRNVVLIGGVGTGKTHLAIGLALACCQKEKRVRFTTAADLANQLLEAKQQGRLTRALERLARLDLVVIDELGYVPFDATAAELLFNFIAKVYERRSLIVTTNLPFARWSEVFRDPTAAAAVIDRVVHHATILKTDGDSYRLKDAQRRSGLRKAAVAKS